MIDTVEFSRIYLAIFYSGVAVFYTARIIFVKRAAANEVVFPGTSFCVTWWNHLAFRFFRVAIWWVCLLRLFYPSVDVYLGMINFLVRPPIILSGITLLSLGFISTAAIHFKLGDEWRSGIDPNGPKKIVTQGLYRYSRNPMFVFVALAQLGFFLALPSVFSLICLVIGLYTLDSQAKAEEKHLASVFPEDYAQYTNKVRRWI